MVFSNLNRPKITEPYLPGIGKFQELHLEKISNQLKLKRRGEADGVCNRPSCSATSFNDVENSIIDLINREKDRSLNIVTQNHAAYINRLRNFSKHLEIQEIHNACKESISAIESELNVIEDSEFFSLKRKILSTEREVKYFKESNRLTRDSRHPESMPHFYGFLAIVFLIETILNGYFFAKGHALGYLGGIAEALLISVVNIGVIGGLLGWFFSRNIFHVNRVLKAFGYFNVFASITSMATFNLLVAHYRVAFAKGVSFPEQEAIAGFVNSTFLLDDIHSYLLVVVGCAFCVFVAIKLWSNLDPYPGFQRLESRLDRLREDYAFEKTSLIEELQDMKDTGIRKIQNSLKNINNAQKEMPLFLNRIQNLQIEFLHNLKTLEQNCRSLLTKYRDENKKHRTERAPDYWDNDWLIEIPDTNGLAISEQLIDSSSEEFDIDVNVIVNNIQDSYDLALAKIMTLDQLNTLEV